MIRKPKNPVMPKLPKRITDNLYGAAAVVQGRVLGANFASDWKLSNDDARDLLQYLYDIDYITLRWSKEKRTLLFLRKELPN